MPRAGHDGVEVDPDESRILFQPTCPVRGTTDQLDVVHENDVISTHVPRAGHDIGIKVLNPFTGISTHVPRAGHDNNDNKYGAYFGIFQPTCPVRGTT